MQAAVTTTVGDGTRSKPTWEDRLNPVFVKELRQAVRGPLVLTMFYLTLCVMFGLLSFVMLKDSPKDGFHTPNGRLAFFTLLPSLTVLAMGCVTAWGGWRMAIERSLDEEDTLYFTPLAPERIIHEKLFSGLAVTSVFYAAGAPFLLLTMMMRGVDVTLVAFITVLHFQTIIVLHQAALVIASIRVRNGVKAVIATAVGIGMVPAAVGWLAWLMFYSFTTAGGAGSNLDFLFPTAALFGLALIKVLNMAAVGCVALRGLRHYEGGEKAVQPERRASRPPHLPGARSNGSVWRANSCEGV